MDARHTASFQATGSSRASVFQRADSQSNNISGVGPLFTSTAIGTVSMETLRVKLANMHVPVEALTTAENSDSDDDTASTKSIMIGSMRVRPATVRRVTSAAPAFNPALIFAPSTMNSCIPVSISTALNQPFTQPPISRDLESEIPEVSRMASIALPRLAPETTFSRMKINVIPAPLPDIHASIAGLSISGGLAHASDVSIPAQLQVVNVVNHATVPATGSRGACSQCACIAYRVNIFIRGTCQDCHHSESSHTKL